MSLVAHPLAAAGLYFARVELMQRRQEQEARGVRSTTKLDFEQRMALEEEKAAGQSPAATHAAGGEKAA